MNFQLPTGMRRQIRGLLGNTTGETDIIKVCAVSGFVFAHIMVVRDFDANRHFDFMAYWTGLGAGLAIIAGSFRLRGDHDTPP